jgi:hypothetical protein
MTPERISTPRGQTCPHSTKPPIHERASIKKLSASVALAETFLIFLFRGEAA